MICAPEAHSAARRPAPPRSNILVSQRVHAEVDTGVLADDLGEVQLHGFKRPVHAFRLVDLRGKAGAA